MPVATMAVVWWIWRSVAAGTGPAPAWLLPWFALTRVPFATFFAYQLAEILEVLTRYSYLSHLQTGRGATYAVLAMVIVVRPRSSCDVWSRGSATQRR